MGEFIFNRGRSRTHHSYPDTRIGANGPPVTAFARNYAAGPGTELAQPVTAAGTQIAWGTIDVPATDSEDVPITPRVSGIVMARGEVALQMLSAVAPHDVQVQLQIDDVTYLIPDAEKTTVPASDGEGANGFQSFSFVVELTGLPLNTQSRIQVLVTADADGAVTLPANSSTLELQEVPAATG